MIKRSFQNENVPNGAPNIFEGEIDYKIESKSLHDFKIKVKFLAVTVLFSFAHNSPQNSHSKRHLMQDESS